jgi:hypothetical protein
MDWLPPLKGSLSHPQRSNHYTKHGMLPWGSPINRDAGIAGLRVSQLNPQKRNTFLHVTLTVLT